MNVANVRDASSWFQVLQTTKQSQTAMMTLPAEGQSSEEMNVHEKSDQILLVIEGELNAVVNGQSRVLKQGDICVIPAGTKHRFVNRGKSKAVTFNVYTPPEYPARERN
jgi:mannose-6-phosphate isomerase-like protein (cupin superfamily)